MKPGGWLVAALGLGAAVVLFVMNAADTSPPRTEAGPVPTVDEAAAPRRMNAAPRNARRMRTGQGPAEGAQPNRTDKADAGATSGATTTTRAAEAIKTLAAALGEVTAQHRRRRAEAPGPRGPYTPDGPGVRAAVQAAVPELKACYQPWLELNPDLGGRVTLGFRIPAGAHDGGPQAPQIETKTGTLGNDIVDGCVQDVFSDLPFVPPEDEDVTVNYPLVFSNADTPGEARPPDNRD